MRFTKQQIFQYNLPYTPFQFSLWDSTNFKIYY